MAGMSLVTITTHPIEYAIGDWLHAKTLRTGSVKTKQAYRDVIGKFRAALQSVGLDLDSDPARVADVAQGWASQPWAAGREQVSANTYNQRLAILSSFYAFARKRRLLPGYNPIDSVERRPVQAYANAQPLDNTFVAARMAAIDRAYPEGKRDYALLAIYLTTGRRLSELLNLRWGDVAWASDVATLHFHAKGGKEMYDTLTPALSAALAEYVKAVHGDKINANAFVWVSLSRRNFCGQLSDQAVSNICKYRLGTSKVHATRHTFAHNMEEAGAKVSDIQARLGHSSIAITGRYLASQRSAVNKHGRELAHMLGLDE